MVRGKIEIKIIENTINREMTFSRRRGGLMKKAHELAVLTDAKIGLIVFSASGKLYQYHSPSSSMEEIIDGFQKAQNTHFDNLNNQQQLHCEMAKIRREMDKLQSSLKQITGENLTGLTVTDLNQYQLINQQLQNIRQKMEEQQEMVHKIKEITDMEFQKVREMKEFLDNSRNLPQLGPEI